MIGVMHSIRRPHTDNIKSRRKKWEIRKTKPSLDVPFMDFIYEPKSGGGCGKVIGQFICDEVREFLPDCECFLRYGYDINDDTLSETCLTQVQLKDYGKGKILYGLHILELKIYEKPRALSSFIRPCPKNSCEKCSYYWDPNNYYDSPECLFNKKLKRPPQSWCYVEVER